MSKGFAILSVLTMSLVSSTFANRVVGQDVVLGRNIPASQQISIDKIDHSAWDQLLQSYVDERGFVNYKAWHASRQSGEKLNRYLKSLSAANPHLGATRRAQLAFWINTYNAVTIRGILREYPTSSIRNHTAKIYGYNIWKNLHLNVGGLPISLHDMEHERLRKMNEPRIHFAIVCASYSCPRLLNHAYAADQIEEQLTANTKNFFANRENFQFDRQRREFKMSSIMRWYSSDFGNSQATQLKAIAPYLPTPTAVNAAQGNSVRVSYLKYNWSLNEQ